MSGKAADPPALMTLIALSGLSVISLNMFLPSLANIAHEFQADYALVNLCIAVYAAVSAVLQLVMGPLSDRFGRRPVILAALLLFLVASLGCLLAANVWVFLAFRMMQGGHRPRLRRFGRHYSGCLRRQQSCKLHRLRGHGLGRRSHAGPDAGWYTR